MSDADVGKPLLASRMPSPHDFAPQPIDWRKVAAFLDEEGKQAQIHASAAVGEIKQPLIATAMILLAISAAIEDGLS